jgi:CheY-like chemotaxis protein
VAAILVVDDEFALAQLLEELLVLRGHRVTLALNGQLALAHLQKSAVDLVLCDVMMPIMTGTEMVSAMRAEPRFSGVPVILMSAQPQLVADASSKGLVERVLVKPFTPRALYEALEALLPRSSR